MKKFEEQTMQSEHIFKGRVISLQVDTVQLPDGQQSTREIVKHPGAVAVIAITDDGKLVFVEQYRKALERSIIEIPAGKMEQGEQPIVTARRELEEETGYGCEELVYVQSFATSPGFADEIIHLYAATKLIKMEQPQAGDDDEFIEVMHVTIEEAEALVASGEIFDAKTAFAVLWAKMQIQK